MRSESEPSRDALSLGDLVAATPAGRERYVDALRLISIIAVVFGHWTMAAVAWEDGKITGGNALEVVPGLWIATWLLQVMPVFFFVGGFANYRTLESQSRQGLSYGEFAWGRVVRLLRPVALCLAVWLVAAIILDASTLDTETLRTATRLVTQPLWFVGVYLIVVSLAPVMARLHRRFAGAVPVVLALGAGGIDALRFALDETVVGYPNFVLVWLFAQQLGFWYADGHMARWRHWKFLAMIFGGLAALSLLVGFGPYPASMVGLPGDKVSNMAPPTVCLVALTLWQVGLVMALRPVASGFLERAAVWKVVIVGNTSIMTIFLWHLTALMIGASVLLPAGFPQPKPGTGSWWALRPIWYAALVLILAPIVWVLGRFERPRVIAAPSRDHVRAEPSTWHRLGAIAGVVLVIVGVCGFAVAALYPFLASKGGTLIVWRMDPVRSTLALAIGVLLLRGSSGARKAL